MSEVIVDGYVTPEFENYCAMSYSKKVEENIVILPPIYEKDDAIYGMKKAHITIELMD